MLDAELFNDKTPLDDYHADVWRVVESQEDAATLCVVDDLAEQALLEKMLDQAKPRYRAGTEGMHYLLKTAFRYPPLPWGSRFGGRSMPSYFYASEQLETALCECAYYRFLFLQDMQESYEQAIRSESMVFNVLLQSDACLDLTNPMYDSVHPLLTGPVNYDYSQQVGAWVYDRKDEEGKVGLIRFSSARAPLGINVAVIEPSTICSLKPKEQQRWLCFTKSNSVSFNSRESEDSYVFNLQEFCDDQGRFLRIS